MSSSESHFTKYWEACSGCPEGHSSFHKTVVESPQWEKWEEEQRKRFATEDKTGCFDVDEVTECGWISQKHFQEFIKFCKTL